MNPIIRNKAPITKSIKDISTWLNNFNKSEGINKPPSVIIGFKRYCIEKFNLLIRRLPTVATGLLRSPRITTSIVIDVKIVILKTTLLKISLFLF